MTRKTEFQELYSNIRYNPRYRGSKTILYYENDSGLKGIEPDQIHNKKLDGNYLVNKIHNDVVEVVEIPEHKFWVVTINGQVVFDRRRFYRGKKVLSLPKYVDDGSDSINENYLPLQYAVKKYNWNITLFSSNLIQNIRVTKKGNLFLYRYTDNDYVNRDHPILAKCRGLVLSENGDIVAYPFDRFFNMFEVGVSHLNPDTISVQEKVDGTLINVWYYNGEWQISTIGNLYGNKNAIISISYRDGKWHTHNKTRKSGLFSIDNMDFDKLFRKYFNKFNLLDVNYTYMFELVTKKNQLITQYDEEFVILLGMRNKISLLEERPTKKIAKSLGVRLPKLYLASLNEVNDILNNMRDDEEGIVICDERFNRLKIKKDTYLHRARLQVSNKQIFDHIIERVKIDSEILHENKKLGEKITQMRLWWSKVMRHIEKMYQENMGKNHRDTDYSFHEVLLLMRLGKSYTHLLKWKHIRRWNVNPELNRQLITICESG